MQRREFFSSLGSALKESSSKEFESLLRPPYYEDESLFLEQCKNCEAKCLSVCEEEIIKIAEDKTPYLVFGLNGCTFCDECALACEFDVLTIENKQNIHATINIDVSSCLAWNATMCFSCKEPCMDNAIIFEGLFKPIIDTTKCTSCGFCISRCPVDSIKIIIKGK